MKLWFHPTQSGKEVIPGATFRHHDVDLIHAYELRDSGRRIELRRHAPDHDLRCNQIPANLSSEFCPIGRRTGNRAHIRWHKPIGCRRSSPDALPTREPRQPAMPVFHPSCSRRWPIRWMRIRPARTAPPRPAPESQLQLVAAHDDIYIGRGARRNQLPGHLHVQLRAVGKQHGRMIFLVTVDKLNGHATERGR